MPKQDAVNTIRESGIIAIIRADGPEGLVEAASALYAAGILAVEISLTTPGTLTAVAAVQSILPPGCLIGVGTVMDARTVHQSVRAGAQFVVSPICSQSIIQACLEAQIPVVSGAYSPTEAWNAFDGGADFIKIFPANQLGPEYMKALLAPMPQLTLVPTGGVTVQNCLHYLRAGCAAVAIGTSVVNAQLIREKNWQGITTRAEEYVRAVRRARDQS